jgi:hypothetical protein
VSPSVIEQDTLSYFLISLAKKRDGVCEETDSPNPLYTGLRDLVCRGDTSVLRSVDVWEPIGKPYYPFILIDYYLLFHRRDFDTSLMVYEWLRDSYERHPYTFDPDEKCGLRVLGEVVSRYVKMCRGGCNSIHGSWLKEIAQDVEKVQCPPNGWGIIFKAVVLSHLYKDKKEKSGLLEYALARIRDRDILVVDEDIAEAYNLVSPKWGLEVVVFLGEVVEKLRDSMGGEG